MHRHGYKGRKFGRQRDQRQALLSSLAESLIEHESIETTLSKAKEIVPYMEHLITKAKKGDLHSRRQIINQLQTVGSAHKLVDELAPKLMSRTSGHLRLSRTKTRVGDNVQLASVSFIIDEPGTKAAKTTAAAKPVAKGKVPAKPAKPKAKVKT